MLQVGVSVGIGGVGGRAGVLLLQHSAEAKIIAAEANSGASLDTNAGFESILAAPLLVKYYTFRWVHVHAPFGVIKFQRATS
jgi:hypothetical protein